MTPDLFSNILIFVSQSPVCAYSMVEEGTVFTVR